MVLVRNSCLTVNNTHSLTQTHTHREWMNEDAGTLERQKLLEFATGSPRSPLDGFNPPFELKGTDEEPSTLPRAHTCFHQLILPNYKTKSSMVEKLTKALDYADRAGFQFL